MKDANNIEGRSIKEHLPKVYNELTNCKIELKHYCSTITTFSKFHVIDCQFYIYENLNGSVGYSPTYLDDSAF